MSILLSRQFRYFIKLMDTCCLNQAADELCITRSPLGKVLTDLEKRIGNKLFIRKYNELIPTDTARALYQRIKPVYDILRSLEDEFDHRQYRTTTINIVFDVSVPTILCRHFLSQMNSAGLHTTTRRIDITMEDISVLLATPETILLSYRSPLVPACTRIAEMKAEKLNLHLPAKIDNQALADPAIISRVPLLLRKDRSFSEMFAGSLLHFLHSYFPGLHYVETDDELAAMMYRVAAGEAMVLMPERISSTMTFPDVRKYSLPDVHSVLKVLHHKKVSNTPQLDIIINIVER